MGNIQKGKKEDAETLNILRNDIRLITVYC
jgi:hypothetical protein